MATVTTIYTGDTLDVLRVRKDSQLDFTTWTAEGFWLGVPERTRVWQFIGDKPIEAKLFTGAVVSAAQAAGESAILVTVHKVDAEVVSTIAPDEQEQDQQVNQWTEQDQQV